MESTYEQLMSFITSYGLKVIGAFLILIAGRIGARIARRLVRKAMERARVDPTVITFTSSLAYVLVLTFAVLAMLSQFGVQTASFVAILGAVGFAIGFALQGSLSNFAAGLLVLVLRPYRVGDVIEAAGAIGKVVEIQLFTTVINTADNLRILVPNAKIYGDVIKNITANPTRRVDLTVGIGYGSPIRKAKAILEQILSEDARILTDPAPSIVVTELADSSVNLAVRPWVKAPDWWAVRCDLTQKIKETFDENGIDIPFPQRTVHLIEERAAG